VSRLNSPEKSD